MNVSILFADEGVGDVESAVSHLKAAGVWQFFDKRAINFVASFSGELLKNPEARKYPDIVALGYWFRRSNLMRLADNYDAANIFRLGRGIALHIAPSNVDTIFVYSFFLSLLSGNTNFIRVSQAMSPQLDLILSVFRRVLDRDGGEVAGRFVICTYAHENEVTQYVSEVCELRVVWGGDNTVDRISSIPLKPTALELKFPNRTSFSVVKLSELEKLDDPEFKKLCIRLLADIQLFGQQACSSPLSIFFIGPESLRQQSQRFWAILDEVIDDYGLSGSEVMDRFVGVAGMAIDGAVVGSTGDLGSRHALIVTGLNDHPRSFRDNHPGNGLLVQYFHEDLSNISTRVDSRDQTVSMFGFDALEIKNFLSNIHGRGVDRVVPIGSSLDFGHVWDGLDLLDVMSRKVDLSRISINDAG